MASYSTENKTKQEIKTNIENVNVYHKFSVYTSYWCSITDGCQQTGLTSTSGLVGPRQKLN